MRSSIRFFIIGTFLHGDSAPGPTLEPVRILRIILVLITIRWDGETISMMADDQPCFVK